MVFLRHKVSLTESHFSVVCVFILLMFMIVACNIRNIISHFLEVPVRDSQRQTTSAVD